MALQTTATPEFQGMVRRGQSARLPRWQRSWQSGRLEEPWRVGPLVALAEPAVSGLCAVVVLLLTLQLGAPLTPGVFLLLALALAFPGYLLGRYRASEAFRGWARLAAELPFPLVGADRLLRRSSPFIRLEIRFAVPLPLDPYLFRTTLDAAAVPGATLMLLREGPGSVVVIARGYAWAAAWAVRRLLKATLPAFHEAFPIERVELCPPPRRVAGVSGSYRIGIG